MSRFWLVAFLAACGDDPTGPVARFAIPASGLPAVGAVPWPSELYMTDADGTVADALVDYSLLGIDGAEPSAMFAQAGALDGFGTQAGVVFAVDLGVDDVIDPATLTVEANTFALVDLDSGAIAPSHAGYDALAKAIVVIPDAPLVPGHRYGAAITSDIRLATGAALRATEQFRELRDGSPSGDRAMYREASDLVARHAGLARDKVVAATSYRTHTDYLRLKPIRDGLASGRYGAAPTLLTTGLAAPYRMTVFGRTPHAGWTATLDEWLGTARKDGNNQDLTGLPSAPEPVNTGLPHDAIAAVLNAAYVSPMFPRMFAESADYEDGTIARNPDGTAIAADLAAQVPVTIVIPQGTEPPGGFPVVLFQHGSGEDRLDAFAVANELARAGIATVAIDAHLHGLRVEGATDMQSNGRGTYTGPDGFSDSTNPLAVLELAGNMRSLLRQRDNNWQLALDLVQLRRLIENIDLTPIAAEFGNVAPRLDATRVAYWGYSMGGIAGTLLAAVEPRTSIDPFVLSVPAARGSAAFSSSPYFNSQLALLAAIANIPFATFDAYQYSAAFAFIQNLLDANDAAMYAPSAGAEHNLWFLSGHQDESVPHVCSDILSRALGATQLTPTLRPVPDLAQGGATLTPGPSGRVVGFYEVAPGGHGHAFNRYYTFEYEPPYPREGEAERFPKLPRKLTLRQPIIGVQRAVVAFVRSVWAGAPRIDVADASFLGLAPIADFDDDGHCDETERAAGTSPFDPASKPTGTGDCVRDLGFVAP